MNGDTEEFEDEAPKRRGPGRPRKKRRGVARTTTTTTRQEAIEPEDDTGEDQGEVSPIFDGDETDGIVKIRIERTDPTEGVLGYFDGAVITEREILERWGGSVYRVQGINSQGRIVKSRQVRIAGDPIFQGAMAEARWKKEKDRLSPPAAAPGAPGLSMTELMALMKEQQASERQAETERREREKENDRAFAERMRLANEESERRRRIDEEEREARRRRDDEDRDRRRQQQQEESDRRQQAFMQQTVAMLQASNQQALEFVKATAAAPAPQGTSLMDSIKTVLAIKEAFGGEGGGSDEPMDPMSLIARHGGEWLNGLGNAAAGAIRELKGKDAAPPAVQQGAPPQRQLQPQQPNAVEAGGFALPPTLAPKVAELAMKIAAQGGNPEEELGKVVDFLNAKLDGKSVKPPPVAGVNIDATPAGPAATTQSAPPTSPVAPGAPGGDVPASDRLHGAVVIRFERRAPQGSTPAAARTNTTVPSA
jgi:hypothetical protein